MLISFFLLIIWLAILIFWADYLVKWAWSLSKKAGIPPLVVWLTVVAFWTSAPELIVNIFSALKWTTDLALGNIIGSNIANILLILWVAGLFGSMRVSRSTTRKEIPFSLLAVLAVRVMGNDILLDGWVMNVLTRTDGLALLWFFAIFMYYTVDLFRSGKQEIDENEIETYPVRKSVLFTVWWCLGLFFWGKLLVDNAIDIATALGISERIIWLSIVAIGTSLPELATSVIAVKKWHTDIAIGNVVGSNIFNIFWILWVTSIISPIAVSSTAQIDIMVVVGATLLLFFAMFVGKKHHLHRWQSTILLVLYVVYMGYLFVA
jgi:cation:H+ antiporter